MLSKHYRWVSPLLMGSSAFGWIGTAIEVDGSQWGSYTQWFHCPTQGTGFEGFQARIDFQTGTFNDGSGFNGIRMYCAAPDQNQNGLIEPHGGTDGDWSAGVHCAAGRYLMAHSIAIQKDQGTFGDDHSVIWNRFKCSDGEVLKNSPEFGGQSGTVEYPGVGTFYECPAAPDGHNQYFSEIMVKTESGGTDNTGINNLGFKCTPVVCHSSCKNCDGLLDNMCTECFTGADLKTDKKCMCNGVTYHGDDPAACLPITSAPTAAPTAAGGGSALNGGASGTGGVNGDDSDDSGTIIGIVVTLLVLLAVLAGFLFWRRRQQKEESGTSRRKLATEHEDAQGPSGMNGVEMQSFNADEDKWVVSKPVKPDPEESDDDEDRFNADKPNPNEDRFDATKRTTAASSTASTDSSAWGRTLPASPNDEEEEGPSF